MKNDTLIQTLMQCEVHCRICTQYYVDTEETHSHDPMLRLSIECADFCNVAMKFLIMNSSYSVRAAEVCAVICSDLAEACSSFPQLRYRQCAIVCQEAAERCDRFVQEQMWTINKFPLYIHYN